MDSLNSNSFRISPGPLATSTNRCVFTKESILLIIKNFLNFHSLMQFEKAIELIEIERFSSTAINTPTHRLWQTILNVLSQFAMSEPSYYSLMFFTTKFSFRKENHLREIYSQLRNELQKCAIDGAELLSINNEDGIVENCLIGISTEFAQFAAARVELIDFYISVLGKDWSIAEASQKKLKEILNMCATARNPEKIFTKENIDISSSYTRELTILIHLFKVQQSIVDCNLIDSLILLKNLKRELTNWFSCLECVSPRKQSSSLFFFFSKKTKLTEKLSLVYFLNQFYQTMLAKLSLYFHDSLGHYVPQNELKVVFANSSFLHTFQNFYRKSSPQIICILVSRINLNTPFYGFGYHRFLSKFTTEYCKPATGINEKYPSLFIYPQEKRIIDAFYVNIITFVQEICLSDKQISITTSNSNVASLTASGDNILKYLYDRSKDQTFFSANVELNIHITVAYDRKVQEKESTIVNFFNDILSSLRLIKTFQDIRNFTKST